MKGEEEEEEEEEEMLSGKMTQKKIASQFRNGPPKKNTAPCFSCWVCRSWARPEHRYLHENPRPVPLLHSIYRSRFLTTSTSPASSLDLSSACELFWRHIYGVLLIPSAECVSASYFTKTGERRLEQDDTGIISYCIAARKLNAFGFLFF